MRICVLGAGAWGTAVAVNAAMRHDVTLWARDAVQVAAITAARENTRYLPGITLPTSLRVAAGDARSLAQAADLVVVATPMAALRGQLVALRDLRVPLAWLSKGIEPIPSSSDAGDGTRTRYGLLPHEVQAQVAPRLRAGALSGPSFAQPVPSVRMTTSGTRSGAAFGNSSRSRYIGPPPSLSSSATVPYARTMTPVNEPSARVSSKTFVATICMTTPAS